MTSRMKGKKTTGKKNPKHGYVQQLQSTLGRDISHLQGQITDLDKKIAFVRAQAIQHQLNLNKEEKDAVILGPKELIVPQEYLETLEKRVAAQEQISVSGMSNLKVEIESVEEEESTGSGTTPKKDESIREESVNKTAIIKNFVVEGKVGDLAYVTDFSASYSVEHEEGEIFDVKGLQCSSNNPLIKQVLDEQRLQEPRDLHSVTSHLYFLQMLQEEREQTVSYLESEVPSLEVLRGLEPLEINFYPTSDHRVKINWQIIWDEKNKRYRYNIAVVCDNTVEARYRKEKALHRYLSGQNQLKSCEEVTEFVEGFEL